MNTRTAQLLSLKARYEAEIAAGDRGTREGWAIRNGNRVPVYSKEAALNRVNRCLTLEA